MVNPFYGASKKKKKTANEPEQTPVIAAENTVSEVVESVVEIDTDNSVKLPSKKRTYFYKVDEQIIGLIEEGSPESLKNAVLQLRQNSINLDESEKVLIYVATEIMKKAYPSEQISWDSVAVENNNPYVGALESVEQGVFDLSTGNVDYLAVVLPALVITRNQVAKEDYDNCQKSLEIALSQNADSTLANYLMALLKSKQGNIIEAESYLEKAYNKSPETDDVALAYANILRLNGKLTNATSVLEKVRNENTTLAILKQNAYIAFDAKDYNKAELYVARVLQQTPNDLEFVLFRAKILIEKNDYIHAVSLLDMYARHESSAIDYLILRAKVQLDWSKNTAAATETVEKALQLYPDNKDALMFAARISAITDSPVAGKYADELAGLVLQNSPYNEEAMYYALEGLAQRENWKDAYDISQKLISSNNVTPEFIEKYIYICIKMNKSAEAYDYAKKYYDANPENETLMQAYVYAYCEVGNRDSVMKYIGDLLNTVSPKMKSYLYYRRSFLQKTEDNIFADLRSSLISNPRNSDSLFRLYEMYFDKQDYRKAQYYLRQVVAINPNDNSVKQLNDALTKLIK